MPPNATKEVIESACANCSHPRHGTATRDIDGDWSPGCNLRIKTATGYVFCNCQAYVQPRRRHRAHRVQETS